MLGIILNWLLISVSLNWQIRFIDNTDPGGIDHQIAQLGPELASTLVIVISTVDPLPNTLVIDKLTAAAVDIGTIPYIVFSKTDVKKDLRYHYGFSYRF